MLNHVTYKGHTFTRVAQNIFGWRRGVFGAQLTVYACEKSTPQ